MKRTIRTIAIMMIATIAGLTSCKKDEGIVDPDKPSVNEVLTPEENKDKLLKVANNLIGTFNTDDQKEVIELADGLYEKYEEYSWNEVENYFEGQYIEKFDSRKYAPMFSLPAYAKAVALGRKAPSSMTTQSYNFSFESESVVFEANDNTRSWKYRGASSDNSIIFRFKDKNGNQCEAKLYGEGNTNTYSYDWTEEDGYWEDYYNDYWGYWDWRWVSTGETHYVVNAVVPKKINFVLTQGKNKVMEVKLEQDMVKSDHVNMTIDANVANLKWNSDIKIKSTNASTAFSFYYGNEKMLSVTANLPSFKLIDKKDNKSWEEWIEDYADKYEDLLRNIGNADAMVDVMGELQIKTELNDFGIAYREYLKWEDNDAANTRQSYNKLCDIINEHQTTGLYYNSSVKQADIIAQTAVDEWYDYYGDRRTDYYAEGVLKFDDGSTYAFEEYFNQRPFTNLQYSVEDLINAYIALSDFLYDEVGYVEF